MFDGSSSKSRQPLFQPTSITQRRINVHIVESNRNHRNEKNGESQEECEPKMTCRQCHPQTTNVLVLDQIGVDEQGNREVKSNRSPDHDMIEHCPVRCIQGDLRVVQRLYQK